MSPSSVEVRLSRIREDLQRTIRNLRALGYCFEHPNAVTPVPEEEVQRAIQRIEREVGAVPLALKSFWTHIGGVDLSGAHPEWHGCEFPDPLVVLPPSAALEELDQFLADRDERVRSSFPYLVPVAPDAYHKAKISGGMWYNVSVPAVADDPLLNDEPHRTTFLNHIELALQWGGFPGLEGCAGHTWPVERIVSE